MGDITESRQFFFLCVISIFICYSEAGTLSISRCPNTVFRRVSSQEASISVTWDDPDCGTNPQSSHTKGEEFGPGVHIIIYWFATGSSSNQNSRCCSFDIFVSGPDFDLCSQHTCESGEVCEAGVDRYYCYPDDIEIRNCPSRIVLRQPDESSNTILANWLEPTGYDYLGREIEPISYPRIRPGNDNISLGEHVISYIYSYTTPIGLSVTASCDFTVMVARNTGPGILNCPQDIRIVSPGNMIQVDWLEPQIQPNEEESDVIIGQTHNPGQTFSVPSQVTVTYTYSNKNNDFSTTCSFTVETVREVRQVVFVWDKSLQLDKFYLITSNQNTEAWPRPNIHVERSTYSGPVVVFPSRVQPDGISPMYPKGFYPVRYTLLNTDGMVLSTNEFVVIYQADTTDNIDITCGAERHIVSSETGTTVVNLPIPIMISGTESDLAWIEEPSRRSSAYFPLGNTELNYVGYRISDFPRSYNCPFTVELIDYTPPLVRDCPTSISRTALTGSSPVEVYFTEPTASDGCGLVTVSKTPELTPLTVTFGISIVAYTFTDCSNNKAYCNIIVNIVEQHIPVAVTNNCVDQVIQTNQSVVSFPSDRIPTAQYNNGLEIQAILLPSSFSANTITRVQADFSSLVSCAFDVTILDMIPPLIEDCDQSFIKQSNEMGIYYMPVNWTEPRSVMNISGGELTSQSHSPMDPLPVGITTIVEYIFKDAANLTTICRINITVEEAPTPTPVSVSPGEKPPFSFTSDVIITIVVTAVATFLVSSVVFMLSICCCTCCCAVEHKQRHPSPPPPGRATQGTEHTHDPGYHTSTAEPGTMRFVIKIPGIGKVPIYGRVDALNSKHEATSRPKEEKHMDYYTPGATDEGDHRPGSTDYVNEVLPSPPSDPDGPPADPFWGSRVIDDGIVYGYDNTPATVARPAPSRPTVVPRLPPKPKAMHNEFQQIHMEMNNRATNGNR